MWGRSYRFRQVGDPVELGFKPVKLGALFLGLLGLAELIEALDQGMERFAVGRVKLHRSAKGIFGPVGLAGFQGEPRAFHQSPGVVGMRREQTIDDEARLFALATHVLAARYAEQYGRVIRLRALKRPKLLKCFSWLARLD